MFGWFVQFYSWVKFSTPVITEDVDGKALRMSTEVKTWFLNVYGTSPELSKETWEKLLEMLNSKQENGVDLGHTFSYTVALPMSIHDRRLHPTHFHFDSCHAITSGLDGVATFELIKVMLNQLHCDYGCRAHPGDLVPGELAGGHDLAKINVAKERLILLGGSHCKRSVKHFTGKGFEVIDLTVPGWTPITKNINEAMENLTSLVDLGNSIVVCDLLSNVAYKHGTYSFKQY